MLILFCKYKDYNKVSDELGQKYGYKLELSLHSVKGKMKIFLNYAIDKLISKVNNSNIHDIFVKYFSKDKREFLHTSTDSNDLKVSLYSFYLEKDPNRLKAIDLFHKLREFYEVKHQHDSTASPLSELEESQLSAALANTT